MTRPESLQAYLDALPAPRREILQTVRQVINDNLPAGYQKGMQYGMPAWFVPHSLYPSGYHANPKEPLPLASIASQKHYVSLYLMGLYCGCGQDTGDSVDVQWFRQAWQDAGFKLNMGKSCVRFRHLKDVPLDVVAEAIRRLPAQDYIQRYEAVVRRR